MKKAGHIFRDRRRVTQTGKVPLPKTVDASLQAVVTRSRTDVVLTCDQANAKARAMREAMYNKQILEMTEGGAPGEVAMMEWPESPDAGGRMFNAIVDSVSNGDGRLSGPINMDGDRRVIYRGKLTHVILSGDVCLKKFGITKTALIISPFDNSISIGTVEVTR